jgi:general secretion pathway protein C
MNYLLLKFQTNRFFSLILPVLLLSYSLAYLGKYITLYSLGPGSLSPNQSSNYQGKKVRQEIIKSIEVYDAIVTGSLVRGISMVADASAASKGLSESQELAVDEGDTDQMMITGTVSGSPSFARVTIHEKNANESEEFAIGEMVGNYKVLSIEPHGIVLGKNELKLKVAIGETPAQAKEKMFKTIKPGESAPLASSETIQKILSREDLNKKLKDPNAIYKDARFGPNLVDGKIDGYKLYQVSKTHVFYSLGAKSGDIIKRVNGMPLTETEKMLEIWNSIKTAQKVTVDLEREGRIISYDFTIRN